MVNLKRALLQFRRMWRGGSGGVVRGSSKDQR